MKQKKPQRRTCPRCKNEVDDGDWTFCLDCVVDMIKKGESPDERSLVKEDEDVG